MTEKPAGSNVPDQVDDRYEAFSKWDHTRIRTMIESNYTLEYRRRWVIDYLTKVNDKEWLIAWKKNHHTFSIPDLDKMEVVGKVGGYEIVTDGDTLYKRDYWEESPRTMELNDFEKELVEKLLGETA